MRINPSGSPLLGLIAVVIPALLLLTFPPVAGGGRGDRAAHIAGPEIFNPSTPRIRPGSREPSLTRNPTVPQVQTEPGAQAGPETPPEKIFAGPKDIKERIAVYVFLGWLWLSIAVLVYILRLKIQEIDRLHDFSYFSEDPGKSKEM